MTFVKTVILQRSRWILPCLLFCNPMVLGAQFLTCSTTGKAWINSEDITGKFTVAAAGECSDGPWTAPMGRVVVAGEFPIVLPWPQSKPCQEAKFCQGGVIDNFADPAEPAMPSEWLREKLSNCAGIHTEFDTLGLEGYCFGHSFEECWNPKCKLISAWIHITMKPERNNSGNDTITVYSGGSPLWVEHIDLLPEAKGTWNQGQRATTFSINLGNLPNGGGDILNSLAGSVDVSVQDDTSVDFVRLTVRFDCCGRACGIKYEDKDGNGLRDSGEPTLSGWTVVLDGGPGNTRTTTTGSNGAFCFDQVRPGAYNLGELARTGWTQTSPTSGQHALEVAIGQRVGDLDFGNQICTPIRQVGACCTSEGCKQFTLEECGKHDGLWHGIESQCPLIDH